MSRSKTTSIKRPEQLPTAAEEGQSRLGDLSRPIPVDKRIFRRSKVALAAGIGALVVGLALAAAVFVLPLQTWFDQDNALDERQAQLDELQRVNGQLSAEVDRLRTDDGVREAAREEIGYVDAGEQRFSVRPLPPLPSDLPNGWPYNVAAQIISLRQNPLPEPVEPATDE
ncbi:MAG: septum formation initiator family protein [Actinomycetota bacterium]